MLLAQCSSSSITIGDTDWKLTKGFIGLVAVFADLLIVFIFWCSMLGLGQLQTTAETEINAGSVQPKDYTVVVTQEPHVESLEDLPGVYYAWVENINSQESLELVNADNGEIDQNQNNIWNINLGLTNLGYLGYMKIMGKLLLEKKKLDKKLR